MKKIIESNFKRLLGVWNTTGLIKSNQNDQKLNGIDSYELILDGNYILHKADVQMGDERSETLEMIALDNAPDKASMQYFNSKGEDGVMTSSVINNDFNIEGKGLMFKGTINTDNTAIIGKWYRQSDDDKWIDFIDIKLEKQKN